MNTAVPLTDPQSAGTGDSALRRDGEPRALGTVVRSNLAGGDGPLDHLRSARQAIEWLMEYLARYHELPEAVALEFEAALGHLKCADAHVQMAAARAAR